MAAPWACAPVFHQRHRRAAGDCQQGGQVRHAAVEMRRDDGAHGRSQAGGEIGGGHVHRGRVDIDVEGLGAHGADGRGAVSAALATVATVSAGPIPRLRKASSSASVPFATEMQCATPQYAANSASNAAPLAAQDVPTACQDTIHAGGQFGLKRRGLSAASRSGRLVSADRCAWRSTL